MERERNLPLAINIHIIDNKTDKEDRVTTYNIRKVNIDMSQYKHFKIAKEDWDKQQAALDRKYKAIMDLIIWAMNNGKTLELVNANDD